MVVRLVPILPGNPEYPRDTFAGKNRTEIWRRHQDYEKVRIFYRQKCRAGVRTKLLFLDVRTYVYFF